MLGTGYLVAITRVPGPIFNFWVSKEKWHVHTQLSNIFHKAKFFPIKWHDVFAMSNVYTSVNKNNNDRSLA